MGAGLFEGEDAEGGFGAGEGGAGDEIGGRGFGNFGGGEWAVLKEGPEKTGGGFTGEVGVSAVGGFECGDLCGCQWCGGPGDGVGEGESEGWGRGGEVGFEGEEEVGGWGTSAE